MDPAGLGVTLRLPSGDLELAGEIQLEAPELPVAACCVRVPRARGPPVQSVLAG